MRDKGGSEEESRESGRGEKVRNRMRMRERQLEMKQVKRKECIE